MVLPNLVKICDPVRCQNIPFDGRPSPGATLRAMTQPTPPKIQLINTPDYRENYANSVQVRVNLWDFLLMFGLRESDRSG